MSQRLRPRRSVLYMPGSNARALEKARSLPADAVVLDLEDAVAPEQKAAARAQVAAAVAAGGYGQREVAVRINALETEWGSDDLAAFADNTADAICVPKVESPEQVVRIAEALDKGGSDTVIWAMIETPRGVLNCAAIAGAHPRLAALLMGTSDLAKELRVPHTPGRLGFIHALSTVVLAARANGLDVLDGVHLSLDDQGGLHDSCVQGRELGFDGKTLIHPSQIATANSVFRPEPEAVARAHRILTAWEQARKEGRGVAVVDGKLVENLHVAEAERTLAIEEAITAQEKQA